MSKNQAGKAPESQAPVAERKPYDLMKSAKAKGQAEMTEATPLSGYNGDIVSLTDAMKVGDAIEFTLIGIETRGVDQDGKDRVVYVGRDLHGEDFGIWDRGGLNLMKRVPLNTFVRVTYSKYDEEAKRPTPKHQFKIELEKGASLLPIDQAFVPPSLRNRPAGNAEARN